ncbi:uncharacterized protein BX664DRAFT_253812 [Halteromyces radiatus]|uniref:uncharacterized protein n=1 Tax=Halteromyces radiatus TaxID=101107 RepID=UPI00221F0B86|nr:uncharacterized protein BX664DRAFT_253812 [Halteromyces radiatus]KAI8099216.1 hypothetical protein BX664DRAFT_253812 [Halteromyces radiatus]
MKPSTSIHKPTLAAADSNLLSPLYIMKINDTHPTDASTPQFLIDEYQANQRKQSSNHSFHKRPMSLAFLKTALQQDLENLPHWIWAPYEHENKASDDEKMTMKLMRLILTDFYANCLKPDYPTKTNERTPYAEYVIPLFKYFSSVTKLSSFAWCEKGLSICIPSATKLMDGIGVSTLNNLERMLIESSG